MKMKEISMSYCSDVGISMSKTLKNKFLEHINQDKESYDEFLIDKINNPDVETDDGMFVLLESVKWNNLNKTVSLIEELIEENEEEGRLVIVEMPEHCEIGEFDKVKCFYPATGIVIE